MNPVERLEAEQFHSFTESGYSRPARVTCARSDGTKVDAYVKFMGGIRNREFGLGAELLCSLLAQELGLGVPTPFIVNLSAEFLAGVPRTGHDLIKRSLGLNFASESAPTGFSVVPPEPQRRSSHSTLLSRTMTGSQITLTSFGIGQKFS